MLHEIFYKKRKLCLALLFLIIVFVQTQVSWAVHEPDVIAAISEGTVSLQGDMLAGVKYGWFPGQVKEGTLRLRNDGGAAIRIETIAAEINIRNSLGSTIDQSGYNFEIYAVTINDNEIPLELKRGGFVDLDYCIEMDGRCGNELQGSEARIAITAKVSSI